MFSFSFSPFSLSRALTVSYILSHLSPVLPYPPFFSFLFFLLSPLYSPHLSMLLSFFFYPRIPPPFISPFLFSSKCLSFSSSCSLLFYCPVIHGFPLNTRHSNVSYRVGFPLSPNPPLPTYHIYTHIRPTFFLPALNSSPKSQVHLYLFFFTPASSPLSNSLNANPC